jgi:ATP-binding cassette subfamily B protein
MPPSAPPSDRSNSRDLRQLGRLLAFVRPYWLQAAGAFVALLIAAGAVLAIGQAIRRVIDQGFAAGQPEFLDQYFGALFAVVVVLALATFGRFYLVSWLGERVVADIRKAVFDHLMSLSPSWFETTKTGEVLSRLTTDTEIVQTVIGSSASVALRNLLLFLGGSVLLVITSVHLTLIIALVVPAVVLPLIFFGRKVRQLSRASLDRIADVSAQAGEVLGAIQTSQSYTHEPHDRARFAAAAEGAFRASVARIRARAWLTALVMLLVFGAVDGVMWYGGRSVFEGTLTAGTLTAFVFYAVVVASALGALSEAWGDLQRAAGAAERLMELLSAVPDIASPSDPEPLPSPARGAVSFRDVTFRYPARPNRAALDAFTLDVKPGETVALVGPSGAGKTTVFQLLLRFWDPQSGSIAVDGVDIARADLNALRSRMGTVAQEPVLFAATVRENILYGRPDASPADLRAAADAAAALGFIESLPQGFDTFIGERGVRLSGGQRQRLAIARAILRNPPILLLDEATSALDAESERKVQQALDKLMKGRTTLVIAHRLATVLKADRIAVMDQGQIVALGTHGELMLDNGLYARLARLQFGSHAAAVGAAG